MLRNLDRHPTDAACRALRVGQLIRVPAWTWVPGPFVRYPLRTQDSYIIESFPGRGTYRLCGRPGRTWRERTGDLSHCVTIRHLGTGRRQTLSQFYVAPFVED